MLWLLCFCQHQCSWLEVLEWLDMCKTNYSCSLMLFYSGRNNFRSILLANVISFFLHFTSVHSRWHRIIVITHRLWIECIVWGRGGDAPRIPDWGQRVLLSWSFFVECRLVFIMLKFKLCALRVNIKAAFCRKVFLVYWYLMNLFNFRNHFWGPLKRTLLKWHITKINLTNQEFSCCWDGRIWAMVIVWR